GDRRPGRGPRRRQRRGGRLRGAAGRAEEPAPHPHRQRQVIEIRRLTRRFGAARALSGIDLDIPTGETVVIFGHNGSGKTTLIKLIAGLLRPTSGEVLVDGKPPRESRGRLGFLGHDLYLYPHLSVSENLVLFARLYDVGSAEAREALEAVGMPHKKDALVPTLSQGEGQRVALAS